MEDNDRFIVDSPISEAIECRKIQEPEINTTELPQYEPELETDLGSGSGSESEYSLTDYLDEKYERYEGCEVPDNENDSIECLKNIISFLEKEIEDYKSIVAYKTEQINRFNQLNH